ncbi:MAG: hypothetical protein JO041_01790 [Acidobacteria bacterium]|nr:hypothetical protein [Acidobacteriota bacterium]
MAKLFLRMLLLTVLALGPTASRAMRDGGNPPPTCDPFQNPKCPMPPMQ